MTSRGTKWKEHTRNGPCWLPETVWPGVDAPATLTQALPHTSPSPQLCPSPTLTLLLPPYSLPQSPTHSGPSPHTPPTHFAPPHTPPFPHTFTLPLPHTPPFPPHSAPPPHTPYPPGRQHSLHSRGRVSFTYFPSGEHPFPRGPRPAKQPHERSAPIASRLHRAAAASPQPTVALRDCRTAHG